LCNHVLFTLLLVLLGFCTIEMFPQRVFDVYSFVFIILIFVELFILAGIELLTNIKYHKNRYR